MALLFDTVMYDAFLRGADASKLEGAMVFDASNALDACLQLTSARSTWNDIPKRPPAEKVWVEFFREHCDPDQPGTEGAWSASTGVLFSRSSTQHPTSGSHLYVTQRVTKYNKHFDRRRLIGVPYLAHKRWLVVFDKDFRKYEFGYCGELDSPMFGILRSETISDDLEHGALTVFLAFCGLLNCKNIHTETVPAFDGPRTFDKKRRKFVPPKTSYKVLRLTLPGEIKPHGQRPETEEEAAKMRRHICRGHFKNLTHERYRNPGLYWWPEHWRGNEELGTVDKRYEAKPVTPPSPPAPQPA